jgi:hypothetical protein
MAGSRLDAIRSDLEQEFDIADAEVSRLKAELSAAEKDAKAIKDALAALGRKPGSSPKKPALKKVDVIKAIKSILAKAATPLPKGKLDGLLVEMASKNGKSATGLQLRIKEALSDPQFTVSEDGVSLTANVPVS